MPSSQKYEMPMVVIQSVLIRPEPHEAAADFAERVPGERAGPAARRDPRDAEARRGADDGDRHEHDAQRATAASLQRSNSSPPKLVPRTIAANVLISSRPLARDSSLGGTASGRMPYFAGLKNVECVAIEEEHDELEHARRAPGPTGRASAPAPPDPSRGSRATSSR